MALASSLFRRPAAALLLAGTAWLLWKGPGLLHGRAHFGVWREGQGGQTAIGLSLSLNAAQAEERLSALDGTSVTVFLVPAQVALAPGLLGAGHELGLLGHPGRGLSRARRQLEALGGQVRLLKPGRYQPLTVAQARRAGLQPVWPGPAGPPEELLARAEPGGLLDLDGLGPAQVGSLLAELRARGYQPGPVGQLKGLRPETLRGLLQRLYRRVVDVPFDRKHGTVALTQRPRGLFRISKRPYDGPPLTLPDGRMLRAGMPAAELHIYSKRLVALAELSPLTGLRAVQSSLHDVAQALEEREEFNEVAFIYALTIFGSVLGPVGFQTEPLPDRRQARLMAVFFNLLRVLYGAKNTDSQVLLPGVIWMSRATLLSRYGRGGRRVRGTTPD